MDETYGAGYAQLYRHHWWWRAREEFLAARLERHIAPHSVGDALDFGCGDGVFLDVLARFGEPYGIEPSVELLDPNGKWRSRISTELLRPDAAQAGRFGLVVALDVLEHLDRPEDAVAELVRRTAPGGRWVVTVPAFRALWTRHDDLNHHVTRYRKSEMVALLQAAGLEVVEARYLFGWLAVAKVAVRLLETVLPGDPKPPSIPPRPLNAFLRWFSALEHRIANVIPLPFGSSVYVLAQKRRDVR